VSTGDGISLATLIILLFNYLQGKGNRAKIGEVHELVNDRATRQDDRIDQLTDALQDSDTAVPDRPNGGGSSVHTGSGGLSGGGG
jgi:hypothetical protein